MMSKIPTRNASTGTLLKSVLIGTRNLNELMKRTCHAESIKHACHAKLACPENSAVSASKLIFSVVFFIISNISHAQFLPSLAIAGGPFAGWHFNNTDELNAELKK